MPSAEALLLPCLAAAVLEAAATAAACFGAAAAVACLRGAALEEDGVETFEIAAVSGARAELPKEVAKEAASRRGEGVDRTAMLRLFRFS